MSERTDTLPCAALHEPEPESMAWAESHAGELMATYAGQYVACGPNGVLASGPDIGPVMQATIGQEDFVVMLLPQRNAPRCMLVPSGETAVCGATATHRARDTDPVLPLCDACTESLERLGFVVEDL